MRIAIKADLKDIQTRLKDGKKRLLRTVGAEVQKGGNYFIPKDTGMLESSVFVNSNLDEGKVIWKTPYAARLYWNPQYNFKKDVNPNARGLWFEAAKTQFLPHWIITAARAYTK